MDIRVGFKLTSVKALVADPRTVMLGAGTTTASQLPDQE